jgi:hypothetical protein
VLLEQSSTGRERSDLLHRRDLAGQVLYAAIVHRRPGEPVRCEDDLPEAEDSIIDLAGWAWVTHDAPDGSRRSGGPPDHPTPEKLLGMPSATSHRAPAAGAQDADPGTAQSWATRMRRDEPPPF